MTADRRELEVSVSARASSIDGQRFTFQCSLHGLELQPGAYATIGDGQLGQVHAVEEAWVEAADLAAAPLDASTTPANARIALVRGHGTLLDGDSRPFHDVAIRRASGTSVASWLDRNRTGRASLDVGELVLEPGVRFPLDAGGFDRHTFFCGQSGSGKTYALGTILEQLLLETTLRIVVLDPNSDFVRLPQVRADADAAVAAAYRQAAAEIVVRRAAASGSERIHVRFTDCDADERAAVLRLDPIRDREEYGALLDTVEADLGDPVESVQTLVDRLLGASSEHVRSLGERIRNLGIPHWSIWSLGDSGSLQDLVGPGGPRALVVDLGSLETPQEMAIAAESVLAALWRARAAREPVLVVIDEAHNVCPSRPGDEVSALATEHAIRFAAEGRKFGLYLLVSTQRPQRVHELVVSQCDNLVLMRMNSTGDLAFVADLLSFAPVALLERSRTFGLGESLVSGKIASHPALLRFGPRIAEEGGGDVPQTWAARDP